MDHLVCVCVRAVHDTILRRRARRFFLDVWGSPLLSLACKRSKERERAPAATATDDDDGTYREGQKLYKTYNCVPSPRVFRERIVARNATFFAHPVYARK